MTAAIFYDPEGYSTQGPKLMGRHAAGEFFLRGFLQYSTPADLWVLVNDKRHVSPFVTLARAAGRQQNIHSVDQTSMAALTQPGVVYYPGPGLAQHAKQRSWFGAGRWSLCGITHTTSSMHAMDSIADLLTGPVQPWDALICTSQAVKQNVLRVLDAQHRYLLDRLGASKFVLPQLPVIPLGIHTADFEFSAQQRAEARSRLGADAQTIVILFSGRLSFHAKAHPLAMYLALEAAAKRSGQSLLLVECGWHANAPIAEAYAEAGEWACPSVKRITLDGRVAEDRNAAWAGADIFCSLSDNIQETFGIVPIEAMASGLPVVVSDWDGYKDTVREGVDGFRIPTMMPQAGVGLDLAYRHAEQLDTYDMYCGYSCMLVAVDIQKTTEALVQLITQPALRKTMGEAGRARARSHYDWRGIIPQYEQLWQELRSLRASAAPALTPLAHPYPARLDPFDAFAGYPTAVLTPETTVVRVHQTLAEATDYAAQVRALAMVRFADGILPTPEELLSVLSRTSLTPAKVADVVATIPPARAPFVYRSIAWMLKTGILALA